MSRRAAALLAGALATSPCLARAAELCAWKDTAGVWNFSNAQSHGRCERRASLGSREATASRGPARLPSPVATSVWKEHVSAAAALYNLPVELLEAVMAVESNFNPFAVSRRGAMGLMQLMPGTAQEMYVNDAWSPKENIYGGARYLRVLANQYQGDMTKMLAAYNAGPDAVKRAGGRVPAIPETQEYVRKVLDLYGRLKGREGKG